MPRTLADDAKLIVGANLRAARERAGIASQTVAATRAGIRRDRLNRWETGRELPGADGLIRLAIVYRCPIDDFLGAVDEEYDAIIEARIPVNERRLYQAKLDTFIKRTTAAMQLALEPGAPAPTTAGTAAPSPRAADKSAPARARRTPKKTRRGRT